MLSFCYPKIPNNSFYPNFWSALLNKPRLENEEHPNSYFANFHDDYLFDDDVIPEDFIIQEDTSYPSVVATATPLLVESPASSYKQIQPEDEWWIDSGDSDDYNCSSDSEDYAVEDENSYEDCDSS